MSLRRPAGLADSRLVPVLVAALLASYGLGFSGATPAGHAQAATAPRGCAETGNVQTIGNTYHYDDITIPRGQTFLIENTYFKEIGNIMVDGGTLIVRNATLSGYAISGPTNWMLEHGGCMEFTNTNNFVLDDLWVGGRTYDTNFDNSHLFLNHVIGATSVFMFGSNDTVRVDRSILEGFIKFTPFGPQNQTTVHISNSLVRNLGLAIGGGISPLHSEPFPPNGTLNGLRAGHFNHWDLNSNQSAFHVPYDIMLANVTLIPNPLGPKAGTLEGLGWSLNLATAGLSGLWPSLSVTNSELSTLELSWSNLKQNSIAIRDIPSLTPVSEPLLDNVRLFNTTIDDFVSTNLEGGSKVTFIDSAS